MNETVIRDRHLLGGLRPVPLGSYLAGLGLIRLLGEQADPAATAAWTPDGLVIETIVQDIAVWLTDEYVPTPVLSPWNGGSGFGAKDKEPKRRIARLVSHTSPRLGPLCEAVGVAERVTGDPRAAGWDKGRIVQEFRNRCPDAMLPWIDATVVLADQKPYFPPLLGTGGNDGRLDFSTNFHECLIELLDAGDQARVRCLARARDLLAGSQAERLTSAAIGQFDPALAGGQASSPFGAAGSLVNPWEYVLLVEGALVFASGTARRHQHAIGQAARPFTVTFSPDGFASGAAGEDSRGEVWVPVWSKPCTLAEIRQLFGEARASWRGHSAQRAVEFYAATRTLGVARGIDEFVRYGLHRRNGLAFVAVPLDRVQVRDRPEVRLAARIEDWVRLVRNQEISSAIVGATRLFDQAHMAYARNGGPIPLRDMLAALTTLEQTVSRSGRARDRSPVWTPRDARDFLHEFSKKESSELRLAVALASCTTRPGHAQAGGGRVQSRTMRQILLPVDPADTAHPRGRWRDSPVVPGFGLRPLRQVLADVLIWRSRTATEESGSETFHGVTTFRSGIPAPAADLHAFARDELNETDLGLWLKACLALSWRAVPCAWSGADLATLVPTLGILHPLAAGLNDPDEPEGTRQAMGADWAVRLAAGRVGPVHADAAQRLRQAGWDAVPPPSQPAVDGISLAAALVPRCQGWRQLMREHFALRIREELEAGGVTVRTDLADDDDQEANPRELAEEEEL
jgi:CRISPR-associated protein Csx17